MAVVNISFDTKSKSLSVSLNGSELKNVESVGIYKYEDVPEISIYMREKVDSEDITVHTSLHASENEKIGIPAYIIGNNDKIVEITEDNIDLISKAISRMLCK